MEAMPIRNFCQFIRVSFSLGGKDILMGAYVFWTEEDEHIQLKHIAVTEAEVDGRKLDDDELRDFCLRYEAAYMEDLKWIALSSIDSSATSRC
jgi:hypothetical protein